MAELKLEAGGLGVGLWVEVVNEGSADGFEEGCDGPYLVLEFGRQVTKDCELRIERRARRQDDVELVV